MPWAGPTEQLPFPTLGLLAADWMEEWLVLPDREVQGEPYRLTDEMLRFLINFYRIDPDTGQMRYDGGQLRRPQKWGKDPLGAAVILNEGLGFARFDGWDAYGQPVGRPVATPYIPCLGTSEENTANTYKPLLNMIRYGPLNNLSGMDAGETRVILPGDGKIEPVTASARARLGARMTFLTITESHLFTQQGGPAGGYRRLAGNVKRNCAGMNGRWLELTNGYDPSENSEAQVTAEEAEGGDTSILIDNVPSHRVEDLNDTEALRAELLRQYGDSAIERGGWVNIDRMVRECQKKSHLEADRRRFFLNEIVHGTSRLVDKTIFRGMKDEDHPLEQGHMIALGFDGSKYQDATALIACRISDGKLFEIKVWERPARAPEGWRVPSREVDQTVRAAMASYDVRLMLADPYRWQDYLDAWSESFPDIIVEYPTNVEQRFHLAIERFIEAYSDGDLPHDGSPTMVAHIEAAIITKGSRMRARPGEEEQLATHYKQIAKSSMTVKIDAAVAAILARRARGMAIEKGLTKERKDSSVMPLVAWR